jgi:DNA-binding CsgD family transcriptional regulator/tetratricopeptide (TPR) repeat protein
MGVRVGTRHLRTERRAKANRLRAVLPEPVGMDGPGPRQYGPPMARTAVEAGHGRLSLLERDRQLETLMSLHDAAAAGSGSMVFLRGEAGAGKTALISAFVGMAVEAIAGTRILVGSCDGVSTPRPLAPVHDFAAAIGPEIVDLLDHEGPVRQRLFDSLLMDLGRRSPTVLVIEDLHWSDNATLDLLRYLGRRANGSGTLLIGTYRDDEVGPFDPLRVVIGDLATLSWTHHVDVPPLSRDGVGRLVAGRSVDVDRLHELTGGNPFYLSEALEGPGDGEVPGTVRDAVRARVARLTPRGLSALETAVIIGSRVEPWLLSAVAGEDILGIDECLAVGLLVRQDDTIVFRHELTRLSVLDDIPMIRAIGLHRRALHFLEESAHTDSARLAYHAEGAADAAAVLRHAPTAARQAVALLAHSEAIAQSRRALRFGKELPDGDRATLLEQMSYEMFLTNQLEAAYATRVEAIALREAAGDTLRAGDDRRYLARVAWFLGHGAEAWELARSAVAALEPLGPTRELAMAWGSVGHLHMIEQQRDPAVEWNERALELGRDLDDPEVIAYALNNLGTAELQSGSETGRPLLMESLEIAKRHNMQEHIDRALFNLGEADLLRHRYGAAEDNLIACLEFTASCDLERCQLLADASRALLRLETGRWAEAERMARSLLEHPRLSPHGRASALCVLARLAVRRGDAGHDRLLEEAGEIAERTAGFGHVAHVALSAAEAAWLRDDPAGVERATGEALALVRSRNDQWTLGDLLAWRRRAGLQDDVDHAIAEPFALELAGRLNEAADAWEARSNPYRAAMARAGSSDPDALRTAHRTFVESGATAAAEIVARRLRQLGAAVPRGPRARTRAHPASLTEREAEIADLLATGLTNREIAERLVLSEKTVGHHVSAVLGKLGIRRRAEVASALEQHRPLAR